MNRKLTFFTMLLLIFLGAQIPLDAQELNKKYRIKVLDNSAAGNYGIGQYITILDASEGGMIGVSALKDDNSQIFTLESAGSSDQYYLKSANGYYVSYSSANVTASTNSKSAIGITKTTFYATTYYTLTNNGSKYFEINKHAVAPIYLLYANAATNYIMWDFVEVIDCTTPDAPQNLTATAINHKSVALAWDEVENITKYNVYKNDELIAENVAALTYTVAGLEPETTYDFTVTAVDGTCESDPSNTASATTAVTPEMYDIEFTLLDSYGDGWGTCSLVVMTADGSVYQTLTLGDGSSTTYTLSMEKGAEVTVIFNGGSGASECTYTVRYKDGDYIVTSGSSGMVDGTNKYTFVVGEVILDLDAPTGLAIVSGDNILDPDETVQISWNAPNADVLSYNVYCNNVLIAENVTATLYDLSRDECNATYSSIAVTAVYAEGESPKSETLAIRVPGYFDLTINVTNNGNPVADATVVLSGGKDDLGNYPETRTFTTDANGQVKTTARSIISFNTGNPYVITVSKDMYNTVTDEFGWDVAQHGADVVRNITLEMTGPENVTATPSQLFVGESTTVTWTAMAGNGVTYNVYVDGVRHNTQAVTTNQYTITDLSYNINPGHVIGVTAVYAEGETSAGTVNAQVAGTFTLTVNVTNEQGQAIQDATVTLGTDQWTLDEFGNNIASYGNLATDMNGQAVFTNVKLLQNSASQVSYILTISKNMFEEQTYWNITNYSGIANGDNHVVNITMTMPAPTNVRTDAGSYNAGDDALLTWEAPEINTRALKGYNIYKVETDYYGSSQEQLNTEIVTNTNYTVVDVEYGQYRLGVSAVYDEGESQIVTSDYIVVSGYGRLVGTVVNMKDEPVGGAEIVVYGYDESYNEVRYEGITADKNGKFVIEQIPLSSPEGYTIEATMVGYYDYISDASTNAHVTYGGDSRVTVVMRSEPIVDIEVKAVDRDTYVEVSWDCPAGTQYSDVYRLDVANNVMTEIATDLTTQDYVDNDWASLTDGEYQYGVILSIEEEKQHFFESFENIVEFLLNGEDPNRWSVYELDQNGVPYVSDRGRWIVAEEVTGGFSLVDGDKTACSPNPYSDAYQIKYIMVSPLIDLTEAYVPGLDFYYHTPQTSTGTANGLKVSVLTESQGKLAAADAEMLWTNNELYTGGFTNQKVDLSQYAGEKIYLVFETKLNNTRTYVDRIEVRSQLVSYESKITWSNSLIKGAVVFDGNGDWNTPENWSTGELPSASDDVVIKGQVVIDGEVEINSITIAKNDAAMGNETADYSLTLNPQAILRVTNGIANSNSAAALLIHDGAQIYQNADNVDATFVMDIINPTTWEDDHKEGWQIITSPLKESSIASFKPADSGYDLFKYDGTQELEWVNYKFHTSYNPSLLYDFENGMIPTGFTFPNFEGSDSQWNLSDVAPDAPIIQMSPSNIGSDHCVYSETILDAQKIDNWMVLPQSRIVNGTELKFKAVAYYSKGTMQGQLDTYVPEIIEVLVSENANDIESDFVSVKSYSIENGIAGGNTSASWLVYTIDLSAYAEKDVYIAFRHKKMSEYNYSQAVFIDDIRLINEDFIMFEEEFIQGRGYMASYESETTATFTGELNHESTFSFKDVKNYSTDKPFANFYLLGNPFTFNMDWDKMMPDNVFDGYAIVDSDGSYQYLKEGEIKVGDGFFVKTIANNPYLEYTATRRRVNDNYISLTAKGRNGDDNLIINFSDSENEGFNKLQNFNDEIAEIYILNSGLRYAIANCDADIQEMEVCFEAKTMGSYTIAAQPKGEFEMVTLVDKFTGIETNLLLEDYTFTATSHEANNRFVVKFVNGQQTTDNSRFVYQSGEELIINAQGMIQIVDVLGRVVYQSEHHNDINRVGVENFDDATYVVRCVNGNEVKTQKIVIL